MKKTNIIWIEAAQYALVVLIPVLLITYVFHLWEIELHFPMLKNGGDVLSHAHLFKSIIETGWIYTNPSTGAPFGATFLDYPTSDGLHFLAGLIFSFFFRDPMVIYNLYYLCGFPLAAISAFYVLKKLDIPFYIALPGAISFAFLPFHLLRYGHVYLASYYMIPLGLLAILEAVNGNLNVITWNQQEKKLSINLKQQKVWFYLLVCFFTASSGIYYAYFIAVIGLVSAIRCLFEETNDVRIGRSLSCLVLVFVIFGTAGLNGFPTYYNTFVNGVSADPIAVRGGGEAEIYGLKIIQMLLPSLLHRFPELASITQSYDSTAPLVNENSTASLGLMGVIGFLYSLLFLFRQQKNNMIDDYLGFLNIFCVLLATVGGFSSVIAFSILPSIRGYNRISVVIGFLSIAVFCRLVQRLMEIIKPNKSADRGRKNVVFSTGLCLLLLGIIFIDQCYYPNFMVNYQQINISSENDEQFVRRIENTLPQGAMIFQLPFMPFPETVSINKMQNYDHFRPILLSSGLRWSYGDSKGRKASDWYQSAALLPTEQMLQRLAAAGFSGIYIDRFGYQDAGEEIEANIRHYVKSEPIVSNDQRFVFYDIRAYGNDYRSKFDDDQWRLASALALKMESKIAPSGECSYIEGESGNQWIWCGDKGELIVSDYNSIDRNVILSFDASTGSRDDALLFVTIGSQREQFEINGTSQPLQLIIPMNAGQTSAKIFLESNAQRFDPGNGDLRELVFKLYNPTITTNNTSGLP